MSTQSSLKVLTVGPAVGSFRELFAKIKAIDAKHGKFDICLCVGDFFGPPAEDGTISDDLQSLLNGELEVPMECYIMQGPHALPGPVIEKFAKTSGDICKNVFLLSKSAIVTTTHGIRIASLGGGYQPMAYAASETALGFTSPYFSKQTVEKLIANSSSNSSMSTKAKDYTSLASIASNSSASNLVDIFVSTAWPSAITQCANSPPPSMGAPPLDVIVRSIKPRYHFAPGPGQPMTFWEREPYVWEEDTRVSRFVALGAFGGEQGPGKKQRWFYAFTLAPISAANAASIPPNATDNPFNVSVSGQKRGSDGMESGHIWENVSSHPKKRAKASKVETDGKPPEGYSCKICQSGDHFITDCPDRQKPSDDYVCKICNEKGHFVRDCPTKHAVGDTGGRKPRAGYMCRACNSELHYLDDCPVANATGRNGGQNRGGGGGKKRQPIKEIQPDECWFCLSNPNLAKHLITAVGNECYVTLPKGQLIPTGPNAKSKTSLPATPGGGHVLIVPIAHFPTLASASGESASAVLNEVDRYKSALKTFYAQYDADAVFVETARVSAKGGHAHVQAIPVPHSLSSRVRDAFTTMGSQRGINFAEDTEGALAACKEGVRGYFRVDLPDDSTMVHMIREGGGFNLQFGREVMAQILGVEERADWRACAQTEDQEKEDVAAFKAAFAAFDLSS